ncbi:MAG: tRNA 2-thiouridine(34) synthase MnmA [Paludibacteraceae bacterium]|nr:tRNA 2-thiouridine(34) synthase MnmA [Paludibacteraceae bacterium]
MAKRVLIAMSGGIDSSVAAMLLLEQGYELVGVTFRTFDSIKESCLAKEKGCCSVENIMEAKHLAERLGFEHHILDYRQIFRDTVIRNFTSEYMCGRTPNPCVLCNSHIKWGELMRAADEFGCEKIATGHYARIAEHNGHLYLRVAADTTKDQTYFLWMLTEENLRRTVFPLGDLQKTEVRQLAAAHGFKKLSEKRESQEICFIPDNDYRTFLASEGLIVEKGVYVDADGNRLGEHDGYCNYTIGQRKGLGIALGKPCYVTRIDAATNTVQLGSHDDLLTNRVDADQIRVRDTQWLKNDPEVEVRIRYRSKAVHARLQIDGTHLTAFTYEPVWGVTPGQSLVVYKEGMVVAGGII